MPTTRFHGDGGLGIVGSTSTIFGENAQNLVFRFLSGNISQLYNREIRFGAAQGEQLVSSAALRDVDIGEVCGIRKGLCTD